MDRLLAHLRQAGPQSSRPPFVIYHGQVDVDSDGPIETCVPFEGHLHDARHTPAGSPREVYFADWGAVDDDEPACDVAWPYER